MNTITVTITREAVCAADDQTGPLVLAVPVSHSEVLAGLVGQVLSHDFLRFSSSHACMTGFASGAPVVEVHADFLIGHRPRFLVQPDTAVATCLPDRRLDFRWAPTDPSVAPNSLRGPA